MPAWNEARLGAFARKGAAGVLVGTLLAAPLLVASADYVANASLGGHGHAAAGHLPTAAAPQLVLPYVYGPIFAFSDPKLVVFGIWGERRRLPLGIAVLFALVGLASGRHRGLRVRALGLDRARARADVRGTPRTRGAARRFCPGCRASRSTATGSLRVELAVVVLAALGLDRLEGARLPRGRVAAAAAAALVLVALATAGALPYARRLGSGSGQIRYFEASLVWGVAVVLVAAGAMLLRRSSVRIGLASAIVAVEALLLFVVPEASAPRSASLDTAPVEYLQRHLGSARFFTLGPLQPNYGTYFGVASLNANDLPIPTRFADYVTSRLDQASIPTVFVGDLGGGRARSAPSPEAELLRNRAGYRAAGVAYVLTPAGNPLPAGFALVFRSPTTWIYRLAGAEPLVTAPGCTVTADEDTARLVCSGARRSGQARDTAPRLARDG